MALGLPFTNQQYDITNLVTARKYKRFPIQRWVDEDILKKKCGCGHSKRKDMYGVLGQHIITTVPKRNLWFVVHLANRLKKEMSPLNREASCDSNAGRMMQF